VVREVQRSGGERRVQRSGVRERAAVVVRGRKRLSW
jgi:hypothetical protein